MKKQLLTLSLIIMSIGLFSQSTIWKPYNSNLDTSWGIRWLSVVDTNTAWAIGENRNYLSATSIKFTRTQNGKTFIPGTFLPDTIYYSSSNISAVNDSVAYIPCFSKDATRAGIIRKTTNRGLTWTNVADTSFMFTTPNNFPDWAHFYTNNFGIVLGDPNGTPTPYFEIYHTHDGGANWIRVPKANFPTPVSGEYGVTDVVAWYGNKHLWFGTNHGGTNAAQNVYRSNDTGYTWQSAPIPGMLAGVSGLAFRDSVNGLAWGQTSVSTGKFILKKTIDGGVTWTTVIQHNNVGTFDISTIPGKNGYMSVGLDSASSAFITSVTYNDGATWTILESGIQESQRMLQVTMLDSAQGWAGCFSDTSNVPFGKNGMDRFGLNHPNDSSGIICGSGGLSPASVCFVNTNDSLHNEIYFNHNSSLLQGCGTIIYRQNALSNWDSIGYVPRTKPDVFVDTTANPNQQSYSYCVAASDSCGTLYPKSALHKTVFLQSSPGTGTQINLSWNAYVGATVASYYIHRGTTPSTMSIINQVSSSTLAYTDLTPPAGTNYYKVDFKTPTGCTSNAPFDTLVGSNYKSNGVIAIEYLNKPELFTVYPNPTQKNINVHNFEIARSIEITDILGNTILVVKPNSNLESINVENLEKGVYFIKVLNSKGTFCKKFLLN